MDGLKGEVNAHTSGGSLHFDHIDGRCKRAHVRREHHAGRRQG